jgi:error-prone DNA polymerase
MPPVHQMPLSGCLLRRALLNSQPMGFYAPPRSSDARNHGVEVRPVCINRRAGIARWNAIGNTDRHAVRLGMRLVKGWPTMRQRSLPARADQPFVSVDDMWRRSGVPSASLVQLAEADAFLPSLGWKDAMRSGQSRRLRDEPLPLFAAAAERERAVIAEQQEPTSNSGR